MFLSLWNDPKITPTEIRLYNNRVLSRKVSKQLSHRLWRQIDYCDRRERKSDDFDKLRLPRGEWTQSLTNTSSVFEKKLRDTSTLIFSRCEIYECIYNTNHFSQAQTYVLFDLTLQ